MPSAEKKKVLLIGLRSDGVDFEKWPELDQEKLEKAFGTVLSEFQDAGFRPTWCLIGNDDSAVTGIQAALIERQPDVVLIGAGVRADPDHLLLFEQVINTVHQHAPHCRIAFNTLPYDSLQAVRRWV